MKSLYVVYLVLALGAGAIAWSLVGTMSEVGEGVPECARLDGAEQDQCFKRLEKKANAAAAVAKALTEPAKQDVQK
ncbi:hypothetical protein WCE03_21705 [Pseudomonas guariconensis]|uniref:hypothetical protein n=1 Tax=Pseudomonas guariconensis TaxID=1288410 RepID=UPI0034D4C21B